MKTKFVAIALLALIVPALVLPVVADAQAVAAEGVPEVAVDKAGAAEMGLFPPYWDSNDWPSLLVFKGVALKDGKIAPAVFLAVNGEDGSFEQATFIIDGRSADAKVEDIGRYPKNGAIFVSFDDGSLLLKRYQLNYMDTLFASGEYAGWQLNLRAVGSDPVYRIFEPESDAATVEIVH